MRIAAFLSLFLPLCAGLASCGGSEPTADSVVLVIVDTVRADRLGCLGGDRGLTPHLDRFAELPDAGIIYHCDRDDIFEVHQKLGHKFAISGGLPNDLLAFGTADQVRQRCKAIIDGVAKDGGYIMDASAIMQDAAKIENVQAMTDFTREYGVY